MRGRSLIQCNKRPSHLAIIIITIGSKFRSSHHGFSGRYLPLLGLIWAMAISSSPLGDVLLNVAKPITLSQVLPLIRIMPLEAWSSRVEPLADLRRAHARHLSERPSLRHR